MEFNSHIKRIASWIHHHWKSILSKLLLLVLSTGGSVLLVEIFLRCFHPIDYLQPPNPDQVNNWRNLLHRSSSIPGLDYELAPNMEKEVFGEVVKTNSFGMRGDEPFTEATENLLRIVALGDSFTFGHKLRGEDTYPQILEELLNESSAETGYQYEVLNLAVTGYGTQDESLTLKYKGLQWNPDLVLIGYVFNDPESEPVQKLSAYFHSPRWWEHFHLTRLVALSKRRWDIQRLGHGKYLDYLHADQSSHWQGALKSFDDIRKMTSERNLNVMLVIFPVFPLQDENWNNYPYLELHQKIASEAKKRGFQVLDLYDIYKDQEPEDIRLSSTDGHPSPYGNAIAARAIYIKLLTEHALCFSQKSHLTDQETSDLVSRISEEKIEKATCSVSILPAIPNMEDDLLSEQLNPGETEPVSEEQE